MSSQESRPRAARLLTAPVAGLGRRTHQVRRIVQERGVRELGARLRNAAATRLADPAEAMPVRPADVLGCDLAAPPSRPALPIGPDGRLIVNWVTTPPARGSGGHTTMFRLVEHLESLGHVCRLYLYDVYGSRARDHEASVRAAFPGFRGPVLDATDGMADAHAVFATAWMTAYPAFRDRCAGHRFYLVQDYEPWFFAPGGLATLAENTYRMGFHAFTAGRFLADKLSAEFGMDADWFEFGCDTAVYRLAEPPTVRDGVVFFARRTASRRAFELGRLALELFAARYPEQWIHLYGESVPDLRGARTVDHGLLSPTDLNALYNRCRAGLSLSMTNVSLVPHEMLAAGCIPVVNDAVHNRVVLANGHVVYAQPTPHALARALGALTSQAPDSDVAVSAAESVRGRSWTDAGAALAGLLERKLCPGGTAAPVPSPVSSGTGDDR